MSVFSTTGYSTWLFNKHIIAAENGKLVKADDTLQKRCYLNSNLNKEKSFKSWSMKKLLKNSNHVNWNHYFP